MNAKTNREIAVAILNAETHAEAEAVLAAVPGRRLAEIAAMLGTCVVRRDPVAYQRRSLAHSIIGIALDHAAIVYGARGRSWDAELAAAGAAWLAAYRARRIAELPAE